MDKEFFACNEYIQSEEIQYFPAEKYHVNEMAKSAVEAFDAPEISVSQNSSAKADAPEMSLGDAEEFVQSASASASASASLSARASAGVGATGVLAGIAAVCVAVTVGIVPVTGITQNHVDEPPIYQTEEPAEAPIDIGSLNFLNYRVDYYPNEDSDDIISDITFYFEGALTDGYTCELSDPLTGRSVALDDNTATFENVEKGTREFHLTIYNGNEVVETRTVHVEDHYIYDGSQDADYAYKVTYNSDNTCNLYAYLIPAHEGDFVTYINISPLTGVADVSYETVIDGDISGILNINEEEYTAKFISYYVKDNNYYFYCSSDEISIGNASLDWTAGVSDNKLTLSFASEVIGAVEVRVTHDDFSCEEFSFMADELVDNAYELTLSRISHNPTVEIFASSVLYDFDPSGYISETVGVECREVYDCIHVAAFVSSTVSLTRCEIFNASYNSDYDDTIHAPVYLYFDGFLNEGDTYSVKVFNLDGDEVAAVTGLTLSDKPVILTDLSADMEYTFLFYLNAGGKETLSGETTKTLSMLEFPDLPSRFCLSPNPGDALVTYNEDGTSDIYLYMDVQETEYDMYYKVYLVDAAYSDGSVFFEYAGKENVAILRNIPAGRYAIKVGVLINDNGTCYSVYDLQWPSGTIVAGLDQNGYYPEFCGDARYDSSTNELSVCVFGKVVGGLNITITPEGGQPIEITVPVGDVYDDYGGSTCTIDLSAYGLSSFTAVIEGDAIFQYGNGDDIKHEVTVTGDEFCPFKIESVY